MAQKQVIIATPDITFAEGFKKHLQKSDIQVVEIASYLEMLIETIESNDSVDAVILTSNLAKKLSDSRLELLVDTIYSIRSSRPDIRFVVYSNEPPGHPFLSELVGLGIYNLFLKDDRSKGKNSIAELISLIDNSKSFSEVNHLLKIDKSFKWRREMEERDFNLVQLNNTAEKNSETDLKKEQETTHDAPSLREGNLQKSIKEKKPKQIKVVQYNAPDINETELLEDLEIETKTQVIRERTIVGTAIISVAGLEENTGCTHLSLLLANFLAKHEQQVAYIERSTKGSLSRIEYAYEGKRGYNSTKKMFEIDQVDYYKYDSDLKLTDLINAYNYIIIDHGRYSETDYIEDLDRSNIKIMTAHAMEWKQKEIKDFDGNVGQNNAWIWALPLIEESVIDDIRKDIKGIDMERIPFHSDPFVSKEETDKAIEALLMDFIPDKAHSSSYFKWAMLSLPILASLIGTLYLLI